MTVDFLFEMDQRVVTPFNAAAIVDMLGVDDGGKQYHVKTSDGGAWFKEAELKAADGYAPPEATSTVCADLGHL